MALVTCAAANGSGETVAALWSAVRRLPRRGDLLALYAAVDACLAFPAGSCVRLSAVLHDQLPALLDLLYWGRVYDGLVREGVTDIVTGGVGCDSGGGSGRVVVSTCTKSDCLHNCAPVLTAFLLKHEAQLLRCIAPHLSDGCGPSLIPRLCSMLPVATVVFLLHSAAQRPALLPHSYECGHNARYITPVVLAGIVSGRVPLALLGALTGMATEPPAAPRPASSSGGGGGGGGVGGGHASPPASTPAPSAAVQHLTRLALQKLGTAPPPRC